MSSNRSQNSGDEVENEKELEVYKKVEVRKPIEKI
jgi:hypothetical protein